MKTNPLNLRLKLAHEKKVKSIKRNQLNRRARSYNPFVNCVGQAPAPENPIALVVMCLLN